MIDIKLILISSWVDIICIGYNQVSGIVAIIFYIYRISFLYYDFQIHNLQGVSIRNTPGHSAHWAGWTPGLHGSAWGASNWVSTSLCQTCPCIIPGMWNINALTHLTRNQWSACYLTIGVAYSRKESWLYKAYEIRNYYYVLFINY